jgi:hypothetical protein
LSIFDPTADSQYSGIGRYYVTVTAALSGIGAPLAAGTIPQTTGQTGFKVARSHQVAGDGAFCGSKTPVALWQAAPWSWPLWEELHPQVLKETR